MSSRTLHCSTHLPSRNRRKWTYSYATSRPVGGMPIRSPVWRPWWVRCAATTSSSAMTSWTSQRWSEKTLRQPEHRPLDALEAGRLVGPSTARDRVRIDDLGQGLDVAGGEDLLEGPAGDRLVALDVRHRPSSIRYALAGRTRIWCKYHSHQMTDDVKPRRAYRSTKRAEQVAQTRRDIIATAGVAVPRARLRRRVDAGHRRRGRRRGRDDLPRVREQGRAVQRGRRRGGRRRGVARRGRRSSSARRSGRSPRSPTRAARSSCMPRRSRASTGAASPGRACRERQPATALPGHAGVVRRRYWSRALGAISASLPSPRTPVTPGVRWQRCRRGFDPPSPMTRRRRRARSTLECGRADATSMPAID